MPCSMAGGRSLYESIGVGRLKERLKANFILEFMVLIMGVAMIFSINFGFDFTDSAVRSQISETSTVHHVRG
jgi:hypothetical protein